MKTEIQKIRKNASVKAWQFAQATAILRASASESPCREYVTTGLSWWGCDRSGRSAYGLDRSMVDAMLAGMQAHASTHAVIMIEGDGFAMIVGDEI